MLEQALAIRISRHGKTGPQAARGHGAVARYYQFRGESEPAQRAVDRAVKAAKDDPTWLTLRGQIAMLAGDLAAAEVAFLGALKKLRGPARREALQGLGNVHVQQGNGRKAAQRYHQALAFTDDDSHDHAVLQAGLGQAAAAQDQHEEAIEHFERALEIMLETVGETHAEVAVCLNNLGLAWSGLDAWQAAAVAQYAVAVGEHAYGTDHPFQATSLANLAYYCSALDLPGVAITYAERGLAILERTRPPWHLDVAVALSNLANYHRESEQPELALTRAIQLAGIVPELAKLDHEAVAAVLFSTGTIVLEVGRDPVRAVTLYEQALLLRERLRDPDDEVLGHTASNAAARLFEANATPHALALLRAARPRWTDEDLLELLAGRIDALERGDRDAVLEDTELEP
ncbi:MAG: tetratricopeptide repeat protein [Kofleriaceae bacterium]